MTEVAFAAGFGSIRRFNETFQALFDRAPGALRRANRPEISAGAQGEVSILLRYQPPYDWPAMLKFLRQRAIPSVESIAEGAYRRTIELGGVQGTLSVRPADGNALRATIRFAKLSALPAIIARLRRVFDLACRSCRHRRPSQTRPDARAPDRGPAGLTRAGRMGRVRAGGAGGFGA